MAFNMRLNNAYQYEDHTPKYVDKRASLSLSDLVSKDDIESKPNTKTSLEASDYKKELAQLLAKSKGTAYEKTLKKFVETKYREMQQDEFDKVHSIQHRSSLASLSKSKYDSPRKNSVFDDSVLNERKSRLEEISKPMERNKWKGPLLTVKRVSTNHVGRQRPPSPFRVPVHDDIDPPSSNNSRSNSRHTSPSRYRDTPSSRQHSLNSSFDSGALQQSSASVSVQDFNKWLETNRSWERKLKEKVQATKEHEAREYRAHTKPSISAKSAKLAEVASARFSQQVAAGSTSDSQHDLQRQHSWRGQEAHEGHFEASDIGLNIDMDHDAHSQQQQWQHQDQQQYQPETNYDNNKAALPFPSLDVYERLAERGKQYAHDRLNWAPPPDAYTHAPVILERSRKMARGRALRRSNSASRLHDRDHSADSTSRDRSRDHSRDRSVGASRRSRDTADISTTGSPTRSYLIGSGMSRVLSQATPVGKSGSGDGTADGDLEEVSLRLSDLMSSEHRKRDTDVRRGRSPAGRDRDNYSSVGGNDSLAGGQSVDLRALAASGIDRVRSLSASRRQEATERENRKNFIAPDTVTKPFQPTLVAKDTERIMARVKSSFEERNGKMVENIAVRTIIAKRAVSPGPGHYTNVLHVNLSPTKTVRSARLASQSPDRRASTAGSAPASPQVGSRGYSFSKEALSRLPQRGAFSYRTAAATATGHTH